MPTELVNAINKKEGNSGLVFPDNQTGESSAVLENITQQNTDNDMLSDLDIDTLKDIPDNIDARQNHSGCGNISNNVESNALEHENNISDHNTESDHNMPQFNDSNLKEPEGSSKSNGMDSDENMDDIPNNIDAMQNDRGSGNISDNVESNAPEHENNISDHNSESDHNMPEGSSKGNGMDSDENMDDDDNVKDNEQDKCVTHSDDNMFKHVDMEPKAPDELADTCKDTEENRHGNKSDNDNTEIYSNEGAHNSLELNVNSGFTDDDAELQKTIDLDEYENQDVSSLQSSHLDLDSDADEDTMKKLSKSSTEKEKPSKIKEKEKCKN